MEAMIIVVLQVCAIACNIICELLHTFFLSQTKCKERTKLCESCKKIVSQFFFFLSCLTANVQPLSRRHRHSPNVNNCILHIWPKGHWEPHNKVGSVSPAKHLVEFEPSNSDYNALTHQATLPNYLTN